MTLDSEGETLSRSQHRDSRDERDTKSKTLCGSYEASDIDTTLWLRRPQFGQRKNLRSKMAERNTRLVGRDPQKKHIDVAIKAL